MRRHRTIRRTIRSKRNEPRNGPADALSALKTSRLNRIVPSKSVLSKAQRITISVASAANDRLLAVLANSVRVLTLQQAQAVTGDATLAACLRRIGRLAGRGWLSTRTAWITPPVIGEEPLVRWSGGTPAPAADNLARITRKRWAGPARSVKIAVATKDTRNRLSTVGIRPPRESEIAHDLWLAEVFVKHYLDHPTYAWLHEDGFGDVLADGTKPDALLMTGNDGNEVVAVELLGDYRRDKIQRFHSYCSEHGLAYELW